MHTVKSSSVTRHFVPCLGGQFYSKVYVKPQERYLDPEEAWALQGFRRERFGCLQGICLSKQSQMIGNSMSVQMITELFRVMLLHLHK